MVFVCQKSERIKQMKGRQIGKPVTKTVTVLQAGQLLLVYESPEIETWNTSNIVYRYNICMINNDLLVTKRPVRPLFIFQTDIGCVTNEDWSLHQSLQWCIKESCISFIHCCIRMLNLDTDRSCKNDLILRSPLIWWELSSLTMSNMQRFRINFPGS